MGSVDGAARAAAVLAAVAAVAAIVAAVELGSTLLVLGTGRPRRFSGAQHRWEEVRVELGELPGRVRRHRKLQGHHLPSEPVKYLYRRRLLQARPHVQRPSSAERQDCRRSERDVPPQRGGCEERVVLAASVAATGAAPVVAAVAALRADQLQRSATLSQPRPGKVRVRRRQVDERRLVVKLL